MPPPPRPGGWRAVLVLAIVGGLLVGGCSPDPRQEAQPPELPATTGTGAIAPAQPKPNSADKLIFWLGYRDAVALKDADLDRWQERGVDGFVVVVQTLRGMGGNQDYTGDPSADLSGVSYAVQRGLGEIVKLTRARGMKVYLGFYLVNLENYLTPLAEWFDDTGWQNTVLPRVRDISAAARNLGFDGLAFDQELYPQTGNKELATWSFKYQGNTRSEATTRAKVRSRGQELMAAMLSVFPNLEITVYRASFPQAWEELVQAKANGLVDIFADNVDIDFWDGMTSIEGYQAIRFIDAIFYKSPQLAGATWDNANEYNVNRLYSFFSRRLSNWPYAASRIQVSPFAWLDEGTTPFEAARSPSDVAEQLLAFRKWSTGGELLNYAHSFRTFNYEPYVAGMKAASEPGTVDAEPPTITVGKTVRSGDSVEVAGSAHDNLGVRVVRWSSDKGSGTAAMTWTIRSGDYRVGYVWQTEWSIPAALVAPGGSLQLTVEDIKGLVTVAQVSL